MVRSRSARSTPNLKWPGLGQDLRFFETLSTSIVMAAVLFATVRLGSSVEGLFKNVICGQSDACSGLL